MKIILLGPPGAGKGTQAQFIKKHFAIAHISTGDLLRDEIALKSKLGMELAVIMKGGNLIKDELMIKLVKHRIMQPDCEQGFLLDGFPRTVRQAQALSESGVGIDYIVNLVVPDVELVKRLSGRLTHLASGRVYHIELNPPKRAGLDDITNEPLVHRDDDTKTAVVNRLNLFHLQTSPVIEYYIQNQGKTHIPKYLEVNGLDAVETVSKEIIKALTQYN